MQVDIIKGEKGYEVWSRDAYDGDCYEGRPLFADEDEYECELWCEENGHRFRFRRNATLVKPAFVKDAERLLDGWRRKLDDAAARCGRRLTSNITYRASAAWKESPTHYCYSGDTGGAAKLERVDPAAANADALVTANGCLDMLFGASLALWELGMTVTFGADGRHTIFGACPEWVTTDNAE